MYSSYNICKEKVISKINVFIFPRFVRARKNIYAHFLKLTSHHICVVTGCKVEMALGAFVCLKLSLIAINSETI